MIEADDRPGATDQCSKRTSFDQARSSAARRPLGAQRIFDSPSPGGPEALAAIDRPLGEGDAPSFPDDPALPDRSVTANAST
ncbi:hypothetical protein AB0I53_43800 [Saccharopolyspora sp. NPDC050389]|uniref:hypothetical protein n=1 Tax=Saccharopolyspora sp. NPDC050389 TaxID=3155516 RepID=UPI003406F948